MKRLWKSRKALSPVVAAIILIAVTVAVSIAVAAWMGALSFTFMATEELSFTGIEWGTATNGTMSSCTLTIKNTGTAKVTISKIKVNNVEEWTGSESLDAGADVDIDVSSTYTSGDKYAFLVVTSKNNQFGPYTATAPS
jgi:flagellin-like protein